MSNTVDKMIDVIRCYTDRPVIYGDWWRANLLLDDFTPDQFPVFLIIEPASGEFVFDGNYVKDYAEYIIVCCDLTVEPYTHDIDHSANENKLEGTKALFKQFLIGLSTIGIFLNNFQNQKYTPFWDDDDANVVGVMSLIKFEPIEGECLPIKEGVWIDDNPCIGQSVDRGGMFDKFMKGGR